uniref:Uncharacterized protein n=1 Tax=Arundo donax TaxID=35708 RepID=A0A0A9TFF9_ARUDO
MLMFYVSCANEKCARIQRTISKYFTRQIKLRNSHGIVYMIFT